MRLLRLSEVEISPSDRIFRHPRMLALIVWLAVFAGATTMFLYASAGKWKPGYIFGPALLLFLLFTLGIVTARFHPSNWLARANETGVYVQYRSYLNYQLPSDEPSVVFLSYGEIASTHLIKERVQTPDLSHERGTQTQFLRYVELELSGDTAALAKALLVEQSEKALMVKRWYGGSSSTLYQDYPVTMSTPPFLRIRWDVVPRARKFLDCLRPYTRIGDPVSVTQDFAHLQSLSRDAQQEQLRELAARGQIVTAIYTARKLYGCSLATAKEVVEGFSQQTGAK
jgi:hypothetical protein